MIQVKENLYEGENRVESYVNYTSIEIPKLEIGETYTVSFVLKQKEGGSGKSTVCIFDENIYSRPFRGEFKVGYNEFSFEYSDKTVNLLLYPDVFGQHGNGRKSFYDNITITKGSAGDVYMPHKSKVKPDNQAIFPIGGVPRSVSYLIEILSNLLLGRRLQRDY